MANSFGTETPPAPQPNGGNALSSQALAGAPMAASPAVAGPAAQPAAAGGQAPGQAAPQISGEQVVAALRHFDAIKSEVGQVLKEPSLGKTNLKSKIIDGVARLVGERILTPAQAVEELAKVPTEPLQQLKWAKGMMTQAQQAENVLLDHYGMSNPHFGAVEDHFAGSSAGDRDSHTDHMSALMGMLGKTKNG